MKLFLLCGLLLSLACSKTDDNIFNGYIEGEYVYISPYTSGILDKINIIKGQKINSGEQLFTVDSEIWKANIIQAKNKLDKSYANYANLSKGERKQELEVFIRQKAQAMAVLENTNKEYQRAQKLLKRKIVSQENFDQKLAAYKSAKAKVAELEASLRSAMLSAREDELKMAQNEIEIAQQDLLKITKQADNNNVKSKVSGMIEDVYFRLGEYVAKGTPVVSILPPENVKIRFFVPEKILASLKYQMPIKVICDGCQAEIPAKISFISSKAEFTPPVIYSIESRDKMVFMVEATFNNQAQNLHPGLPISVRIK